MCGLLTFNPVYPPLTVFFFFFFFNPVTVWLWKASIVTNGCFTEICISMYMEGWRAKLNTDSCMTSFCSPSHLFCAHQGRRMWWLIFLPFVKYFLTRTSNLQKLVIHPVTQFKARRMYSHTPDPKLSGRCPVGVELSAGVIPWKYLMEILSRLIDLTTYF